MATNLAGNGVCIGQYSVCLLRTASLDSTCTPETGVNTRLYSTALVTMTADPEKKEGKIYESTNGCGDRCFRVRKCDKTQGWNMSGEFCFMDAESAQLMFGGSLILGAAATPFVGDVIGFAPLGADDACPDPVLLEIVTPLAVKGSGDCVAAGTAPTYRVHRFPKAKLTLGSLTFEDEVFKIPFTGFSEANPNQGNPFADYPGVGVAPTGTGYFYYDIGAFPTLPVGAPRCGFFDS